ncbi:MAG TPA: hypothetical protein VKK79_00675, partial [Candidatus Lokiarchaeia archaeon]|nr:hypothetical protein [Candidatus Lokiarchaeia archaeon]
MVSIKWSRVITVVFVPLVPIAIFLYFYFLGITITVPWIPDPDVAAIVVKWVAPALFAFGWAFILLLFVTRIADTFEEFETTSKVIPLRLRFFYGLDALALAILFAFPMITPVIAVIAFASLGWRLMTSRTDWDSDAKAGAGTYIVMILFAIPPAACAYIYIPATLILAQYFWNNFWLSNVLILYNIAMSLSTATTIGSLIYFIKTGASEFEQAQQGGIALAGGNQQSFVGVKVFQVILFAFFLFLYYEDIPILSLFFWGGLAITVFIMAVNLFRGGGPGSLQLDRTVFFGYLLSAGFYVVELGWKLDENLKSMMLIIAALVFLAVFAWKFF